MNFFETWHHFALYVNSVHVIAATHVAVVIIVTVNINLIFLQNVFLSAIKNIPGPCNKLFSTRSVSENKYFDRSSKTPLRTEQIYSHYF